MSFHFRSRCSNCQESTMVVMCLCWGRSKTWRGACVCYESDGVNLTCTHNKDAVRRGVDFLLSNMVPTLWGEI